MRWKRIITPNLSPMSRIQSHFALIGRKQLHYGAGVFGSLTRHNRQKGLSSGESDNYPHIKLRSCRTLLLRAELPKCVCTLASLGSF